MRQQRRLAEAGDASSSSSSTTPNGERTCETTIVAAAPRARCRSSSVAQVDVEQLVAVQREHRPALAPVRRREAEPAAAAERLRLADRDDLGAEAASSLLEQRLAAARRTRRSRASTPAAASRATWYAASGLPGDGHERLRPALRGVAEPLGLAAGEDDRLHVRRAVSRLALGASRAGRRAARPRGRCPRRRSRPRACLLGVEQVAPVDDQRVAHRRAHLLARELAQLGPLGHDHRGVGAA